MKATDKYKSLVAKGYTPEQLESAVAVVKSKTKPIDAPMAEVKPLEPIKAAEPAKVEPVKVEAPAEVK